MARPLERDKLRNISGTCENKQGSYMHVALNLGLLIQNMIQAMDVISKLENISVKYLEIISSCIHTVLISLNWKTY